jgi:Zn-dependent peptidase ImmA (M78 family)
MSSRDEALVTPAVMEWARKKAGYDLMAAASKIGRPVEDIKGWEDGSKRPSLSQARKVAEVYRRSLAVFYLPEPPEDFDTIRDFRRLPIDRDSNLSPALAYIIRQVQNRQEWMHETLQQQDTEELTFVSSASLQMPPYEVASSIRSTLDITEDQQLKCNMRREALNLWVEHSEKAGIFVCRQGGVGREKITCEEARGFALVDKIAPFVFINSNDALVAMMFTLVHELVHLWINQPGLSNLVPYGRLVDQDSDQVEVYCNRVAALALLPDKVFEHLWGETEACKDVSERILSVSERIKISEEVIARRLLERKVITQLKYNQLRSHYESRWRQFKDDERQKNRKKEGGPSPHLLKVLMNGRAFTHSVLYSYNMGRISGSAASHLLNAKVNNFPKLADFASIAMGRFSFMEGSR